MTTNEHRLVIGLAIACGAIGVLAMLGTVLAGFINGPVLTIRLGIVSATCAVLFLVFLHPTKRRHLNTMQRAELLDDVRKLPPLPALVSAPRADDEARSYARQLLAVLREGGWPAHGVRRVDNNHDAEDAEVVVGLSDPSAPSPVAMELYFSLQRVGVDVEIARSSQAPAGGFELFVGHRL